MTRSSVLLLGLLTSVAGCSDDNNLGGRMAGNPSDSMDTSDPKDSSDPADPRNSSSSDDPDPVIEDGKILPWPAESNLDADCECEAEGEVCDSNNECVPRCVDEYCAVWKLRGELGSLKNHGGSVFWSTRGGLDVATNRLQDGSIWKGTSHDKPAVRLVTGFERPSIIAVDDDYVYFQDSGANSESSYRVSLAGGVAEVLPGPEQGRLIGVSTDYAFSLVVNDAQDNELWRTSLDAPPTGELLGTGKWTTGYVGGDVGVVTEGTPDQTSDEPVQFATFSTSSGTPEIATGEIALWGNEMIPTEKGIYWLHYEAEIFVGYYSFEKEEDLILYRADGPDVAGVVDNEDWAYAHTTSLNNPSDCGLKRFPNTEALEPEVLVPSDIVGCSTVELTVRSGDLYWADATWGDDNGYVFHAPIEAPR